MNERSYFINIKKFLLASLAAFLSLNITYAVIEGVLLGDYIDSAVTQPSGALPPDAITGQSLALVMFAITAMSLIMAKIYPKGYEGGLPAVEGLKFGILMGMFYGIPFTFFFGTMFPISVSAILIMAIVTTLEVAVAGVLVGLVYGKME